MDTLELPYTEKRCNPHMHNCIDKQQCARYTSKWVTMGNVHDLTSMKKRDVPCFYFIPNIISSDL